MACKTCKMLRRHLRELGIEKAKLQALADHYPKLVEALEWAKEWIKPPHRDGYGYPHRQTKITRYEKERAGFLETLAEAQALQEANDDS